MSKKPLILCGLCGYCIAGDASQYTNRENVIYDVCDTCHNRMVEEEEKRQQLYYDTQADSKEVDAFFRNVFKDYQKGTSLTAHLEHWLNNELSKDVNPYD